MKKTAALVLGMLLALGGCSWLAAQDLDLCVDYHGKHVCVGRKNGAWTFSAGTTPEEEEAIKASLGGN